MSALAPLEMLGPTEVLPLAAGYQMLAEAESFDDLKLLRDQAEAIRQLLRTRKVGLERQNDAAEIKLRAEHKLGAWAKVNIRHQGGRPSENGNGALPFRLVDLGISKMESSRWQRINDLPENELEKWISSTRAEGKELTQRGLLQHCEQFISQMEDDLELACGGAEDEDLLEEDAEDDTSDYTRPIPLHYGMARRRRFRQFCRKMTTRFGTGTLSDTVYEGMRRWAEEDSE